MPLTGQVHIDRALANVSLMYTNDRLVADALVPAIGVTRESDRYYVYAKDAFRLSQTRRANRSESTVVDYNVSTSTYQVEEEALHGYVSQRDRDNSDSPLSPDIDLTQVLTEKIKLRREYDLAQMMTTTNWANSASLSTGLNWGLDTVTSNPIVTIDSVTSVIAGTSGKLPNRMVISDKLYRGARNHQNVIDRTKYTSRDSVTPDLLATLFGVGTVLVAGGLRNQADEGQADSMTAIWPSVTCFLGYFETAPGLRKVSTMYRFERQPGGNPWKVVRWPEPTRGEGTEAIEVSTMYQFKPIATDCAYLLNIG
jgi:hypothetical protein